MMLFCQCFARRFRRGSRTPSRQLATAAPAGLLNRRTANGAEGAEHAAVATERLQALAAAFAVIEELASVGPHDLGSSVTAVGTRDRGVQDHLPQARGRQGARSCRRAFFRSVASFIFSLKTRISEYSFWISGAVRTASSCWSVSLRIAATCLLWIWCMAIKSAVGKMERYSQLRCGVARNKQATLLPFFAARHCARGRPFFGVVRGSGFQFP
jgi:hypothetical protein